MTGDPAIIGVTCSIVSDMTNGKYNLLKWDRQEKVYYPVPNFNPNEREETYGDYQKGKTMRKEEEEKSGTKKAQPHYNKLYKHLGNDNRNKDVR